MSYQHLPTI